jgi:hypothetical protein
MTTLGDIQTAYKYSLQDKGSQLEEINSTATTAVRDAAIQTALKIYSRRVPQLKTAAIAKGSTNFYAVPADWCPYSRIVSVEYPLDQNPPQYLIPYSGGGIRIQRRDTGIFYYLDPNPAGTFRLTYTTEHDLTSASTIDVTHVDVIGRLAAAVAAGEFAARYANTVSNNLDAVNYRSKEQEWRAVRDMLMKQADDEIRRDEYSLMFQTDPTGLSKSWKS